MLVGYLVGFVRFTNKLDLQMWFWNGIHLHIGDILYPLFYFSCLSAWIRTFSILYKSSGKRTHSWLVPNLCRKALSLSPFGMMLDAYFLWTFFSKFRKFLKFLVYWEFLSWIGVEWQRAKRNIKKYNKLVNITKKEANTDI